MERLENAVVLADDTFVTILKEHIDQHRYYRHYTIHGRTVIMETVDEEKVRCPFVYFTFLYRGSVYRIIWRTSLQVDTVVISTIDVPGRES